MSCHRYQGTERTLLLCLWRLVNSFAAHDADAGAPVFVDVEAIDFDVRGDTLGQRLKCWMNAQSGRDEIDEWRLISDRSRAEELCARDVTATAMRFDVLHCGKRVIRGCFLLETPAVRNS